MRRVTKRETPATWTVTGAHIGAGEGIRTLDVNLGKVALYH